MYDFLVWGANSKSVAFVFIILNWTKKSVLLVDEEISPITKQTLDTLKGYDNFYHMFANVLEIERFAYHTFVNATYNGKPTDLKRKNVIVLQPVIGNEVKSAEIIAKIEALDSHIQLYPLQNNWTRRYTELYNYFTIYNAANSDLLL